MGFKELGNTGLRCFAGMASRRKTTSLTPTGLDHDDLFTRVLMAMECFVLHQRDSISNVWNSAPSF